MAELRRFELIRGDPLRSWSRAEMRDAARQTRQAERELELFGSTITESPANDVLAAMLEQLLDETGPGFVEESPRRA